jgi:methionyl-tRNA synthetase
MKYLVTSALPYANGPLHFGHIAGAYLPADIFVRCARIMGHDVSFICGTDEHGAAITLTAEQAGRTPREQVDIYHENIKNFFKQLDIEFDHFSGTSRNKDHESWTHTFFNCLKDKGFITKNTSKRQHCGECNRFLPDRYVTGECYLCHYEKARGDECPQCGEFLDEKELINPKCKLYGHETKLKETTHWQLRLDLLKPKIKEWLDTKTHWKPSVRNLALSQLEEIRPRDITRDLDWGVPVPIEGVKDKVLYVWFDAPIGYISATQEGFGVEKSFDLWLNSETKLIHFIGKDNIPFHTIIWPAMLLGMNSSDDDGVASSSKIKLDYILPDNVPAHSFYNYEGKKFSTSEGHTIDTDDFFSKYPTDYARWTIARTFPENKDSSWTWKDFEKCVNSELNDTIGNLVNRVVRGFIIKKFNGVTPSGKRTKSKLEDHIQEAIKLFHKSRELIMEYKFREASDNVLKIGFAANKYFEDNKPWALFKTDIELCEEVIYDTLVMIDILAEGLKPFIPESAEKIHKVIGRTDLGYQWVQKEFENIFFKVELGDE